MRPGTILNNYVTKNLIIALSLTIFITTFVGMVGVIGKLFRIISGGEMSIHTVLLFMLYNTPKLLCYTLPIGLLVATVLVFNRMSADNEVTALRASGVSLLQICAPVVLLAIVISGLAWWLQFEQAPRYAYRARELASDQAVANPVMLLEPNQLVNLSPDSGFNVLIGNKEGNVIHDVHIFQEDEKTGILTENITAQSGRISVDKAAQTMMITLENAMIVSIDPEQPDDPKRIKADSWSQKLDYGQTLNRKPVVRKEKEMTLKQLLAWITMTTTNGGKVAHYDVQEFMLELHKRAAWALSPFTFILIGVPLGLQIARRETSAGLVLSVAIAAAYYIPMVIFSESMSEKLNPHIWMWGWNLGLQAAGILLMWRRR